MSDTEAINTLRREREDLRNKLRATQTRLSRLEHELKTLEDQAERLENSVSDFDRAIVALSYPGDG